MRSFIWRWLCFSKMSGLKRTPVVQPGSCTHPPLALVHSRRRGALHLHADISHFLRVKWTHHHHVYVTKLISPNILQTNPGRPRLCTWKSHGQVWNQHEGCWHSLVLSVFSVCCNKYGQQTCVLYPPGLCERRVWWNRFTLTNCHVAHKRHARCIDVGALKVIVGSNGCL